MSEFCREVKFMSYRKEGGVLKFKSFFYKELVNKASIALEAGLWDQFCCIVSKHELV